MYFAMGIAASRAASASLSAPFGAAAQHRRSGAAASAAVLAGCCGVATTAASPWAPRSTTVSAHTAATGDSTPTAGGPAAADTAS